MELFDEFSALVEELERENVEYALCGGLAMAVYAFPMATLDIDILIEPETLEKAKKVAKRLGFVFDAGLMEFGGGKVRIYRMTKISGDTDEPLMLNMLPVTPEIEEVWETRRTLEWDRRKLPVVSVKGLIKLKSMRSSGQDADDIEKLEGISNED